MAKGTMIGSTTIALMCCTFGAVSNMVGETPDWVAATEKGLSMHRASSNYTEGRAAVAQLVETCQAHKSEPMPCFWSAYVATQTVRYADVPERASFLVLRSLIAEADSWSAEAEDKPERKKLSHAILRRAIINDPSDPVVRIAVAVQTLMESSGEDLKPIAIALDVLKTAKSEFEAAEKPRATTPWFNQEWLGFWIGRAESKLREARATRSQPRTSELTSPASVASEKSLTWRVF